jgi:hypothetical protein
MDAVGLGSTTGGTWCSNGRIMASLLPLTGANDPDGSALAVNGEKSLNGR